jgi:hypothetical protein
MARGIGPARRERGAALGVVVIAGILAAITAYATLMMAVGGAKRGQFYDVGMRARYLAEAGWVIATQKLWSTPAYAGGVELVDTNGDGVLTPGVDAEVEVTVGPPDAAGRRVVQARSRYR